MENYIARPLKKEGLKHKTINYRQKNFFFSYPELKLNHFYECFFGLKKRNIKLIIHRWLVAHLSVNLPIAIPLFFFFKRKNPNPSRRPFLLSFDSTGGSKVLVIS